MPAVDKLLALDYIGTRSLAATIFAYIESTYVRREVYESDMASLIARLDAVDSHNRYNFQVDQSTGSMTLTIPSDSPNSDLSVTQDGDLILNSVDNATDKILSHYTFSISNDNLYLSIE